MAEKAISDSEVTPGPNSVVCRSGFDENISLKLEVEEASQGMMNPDNMWQRCFCMFSVSEKKRVKRSVFFSPWGFYPTAKPTKFNFEGWPVRALFFVEIL